MPLAVKASWENDRSIAPEATIDLANLIIRLKQLPLCLSEFDNLGVQ